MSSTGNIEKVQINKDSYPELFLDDYDIRRFNRSSPSDQQTFLDGWKLRRTFLSHFPTKDLPSHFFPRPGRYGDTSFLCGWVTTWDKIAKFVAEKYPEYLEREFDDNELSPVDTIYTTVMFTPHLAKLCDVPTLIIRSSWAGPRPSQMLPIVAIYTNNIEKEDRDRIDKSAGVETLKEMLDLEGPPVWVVDTENKYWPKSFEMSPQTES